MIVMSILALYVLAHLHLSSALIVDADYITVFPGEEGEVNVDVENNLEEDLSDVSVSLFLEDVPFSSVGSSTKMEDIDEDDDENFNFRIRANSDAVPGDYSIPYEISYKDENENKTTQRGSFGIRVSAETDLDYSVETQNNIVGEQGRIDFEIINRGLGEIKSASITLESKGARILSTNKVFIGNIEAEDSDFASFDAVFDSTNPRVIATVEYKDFENNNQLETVTLPIKVYTQEEALELGLIQKNNTSLWIGLVVLIIVLWISWKIWKKKRKNKSNSKQI